MLTHPAAPAISTPTLVKGENMPFIVQAIIHPAPGRGGDVRPLLEEQVQRLQTSRRANLAMTLFGGARNFYVNQLFADLTAADAYLASPESQIDPAWLARLAPLLGQPSSFHLGEVVVPMPADGSQTSGFNYQATLYPKPESGRRLGELAAELARLDQAAGSRVAVGRLVAGEGDARLFVSHLFGSLAEIEHFRQKSQDDAGRLKIIEQALPLMARPVSFEIRQILIAMQLA